MRSFLYWLGRLLGDVNAVRKGPDGTPYVAHLLGVCADKLYNARAILRDHRRVEDEVFERFTGRGRAPSGTTEPWWRPSGLQLWTLGWWTSCSGRWRRWNRKPANPEK